MAGGPRNPPLDPVVFRPRRLGGLDGVRRSAGEEPTELPPRIRLLRR